MQNLQDDKIWKLAQKRVGFRRHFFVYILVNLALIVIWYVSRDPVEPGLPPADDSYWFLYPLAGWGIALAFHYWNAYHDDDSSVDKEFKKIKKRQEKRVADPEKPKDTLGK